MSNPSDAQQPAPPPEPAAPPSPPPAPRAKGPILLLGLVAGIIGGLIAWPAFERTRKWFQPPSQLLIEGNLISGTPEAQARVKRLLNRQGYENAMLSHGVLGIGVGLMLGLAGAVRRPSVVRLLLGIIGGAILGAIGGALGGLAGQAMAKVLASNQIHPFLRGALPRAVAWAILGLWVGGWLAFSSGQWSQVGTTMLGGLLGGLLGGFVFEVVAELLMPSADTTSFILLINTQRLVSLVFAGGSIGLVAGALASAAPRRAPVS